MFNRCFKNNYEKVLLFSGPPKQRGSPSVYSNEPGLLRLQWNERNDADMPVDVFYLQYRIGITSLLLLFLLLLLIIMFESDSF